MTESTILGVKTAILFRFSNIGHASNNAATIAGRMVSARLLLESSLDDLSIWALLHYVRALHCKTILPPVNFHVVPRF